MEADSVWITVSVQDSGKGLSPEDMSKLFERFAQIDPKTEQYGGSVSESLHVWRRILT